MAYNELRFLTVTTLNTEDISTWTNDSITMKNGESFILAEDIRPYIRARPYMISHEQFRNDDNVGKFRLHRIANRVYVFECWEGIYVSSMVRVGDGNAFYLRKV
jgi:hypothetical protein